MTSLDLTGEAAAGTAPGTTPGTAAGTVPGPDRSGLQSRLRDGFRGSAGVTSCLEPLLSALGWQGTRRQIAEALPHFADSLEIDELRQVFATLKFRSDAVRVALKDIDPRLAPCLYQPDAGAAFVLLEAGGSEVTIFNGETASIDRVNPAGIKGTAYLFRAEEETDKIQQARQAKEAWFGNVARRFRRLALKMLGITFLTSLLALVVPLFIMTLYDRVVPSRSEEMLVYLASGVLIAIAFEFGLRLLRARLLAYVGGRIDLILGTAAFQQVLYLPILMTERATIGAQISRLKQFEAVREFFSGQLANVILELPFALVFILVIALVAGPLAWVPVVLAVIFALMACVTIPAMRRATARSGEIRSQKQSFMIEMLSHLRTIKNSAAEATWSNRYREIAARSAKASFKTTQISVTVQTLAQMLMMSAGIATIGLGTMRVMSGDMTVGALIACMALIWRVLSPIQVGFLSLSRVEQLRQSLRQINQLMSLKLEREPGLIVAQHRSLVGEIAFQRVSLRYTPTAEPALLGVELAAAPGELVAVTGPSSSGKSTLLKLIAGLYQPQAGAVLIDGMDIRQLDLGELREAVAYQPQVCHFFHGTIAQNLRLANPLASDEEISRAAAEAGLLGEVLALPEGFETRLTDQLQRQLPNGFKQRLMLARAYVKNSRIMLLDEPGANLDDEGDRMLQRKLQSLKGKATVFIATHRPSHMRLADRVVYMQGGRVLAAGPPDEILPKLQAG